MTDVNESWIPIPGHRAELSSRNQVRDSHGHRPIEPDRSKRYSLQSAKGTQRLSIGRILELAAPERLSPKQRENLRHTARRRERIKEARRRGIKPDGRKIPRIPVSAKGFGRPKGPTSLATLLSAVRARGEAWPEDGYDLELDVNGYERAPCAPADAQAWRDAEPERYDAWADAVAVLERNVAINRKARMEREDR